MHNIKKNIEIDGNDGTGKTTLVSLLKKYGIHAIDRGKMTKATDNPELLPEKGSCYILLNAPVKTCQQRLLAAGKSLDEPYHCEEDLVYYEKRFLEVAKNFNAYCVDSTSQLATLQTVLSIIFGQEITLGIPRTLLNLIIEHLQSKGFEINLENKTDQKYSIHLNGLKCIVLQSDRMLAAIQEGTVDIGIVEHNTLIDSGLNGLESVNITCKDINVLLVYKKQLANRADLQALKEVFMEVSND